MSGSASISLEQAILGHTLGFQPMTMPASVWVALCSASMPPSETVQGIEAFGGGYTRMRASFALVDTPANVAANTTSIEFAVATASWGTLGYFELWDAPTGGNRLYWGQFSPATPITVSAGDIPRFSPGNLAVQASSGTGTMASIGAYLPLAGGQLSGALMLAADPTTYLQAATKQYVDAHSGTGGGPGFLPLSGGTMLGTLSLAGNATLPMQAVPLQQLQGGPIVSVLDHGAKGDGTTDDTAAFQAVLNTYAGKATVFIPDTGSQFIVGQLSLPAGTDLLISGYLLLKSGTNVGGTGMLTIVGHNNITIRGHGTIDGNRASAQSAGIGTMSGCNNIRISEITIRNAYYWNLNVTASTNVRVDKVTMIGGGNANQFAAVCDNCWITNCTMDGPTTDFGFAFYGGITNSGAVGNVVKNSAAGIYVFADSGQSARCENITIANNIVYNNAGGGIATDAASATTHVNITITGNRCYGNNTNHGATTPEIWADHTYGVTVTGNLVSSDSNATNAGSYGIGIGSGAYDVVITGNSAYNIGNASISGTGLYVNSAGIVQATGNVFHDFRTPKYMTTSISGAAAIGSCFIGNLCEAPVSITPASDTVIANALSGRWTINNQSYDPLPTNAVNDAAAAAAGVPPKGVYRNGSALMVRVV